MLPLHIGLSVVGIMSGIVAVVGMISDRYLPVWSALFLLTTLATGVTGYFLPPFGLDPPRIVGTILIFALAMCAFALYVNRLAGAGRPIYVVASVFALYLNVFVAIVQAFQKIRPLHALAPTQTETPFLVANGVALVGFVAIGFLAWRHFRITSV